EVPDEGGVARAGHHEALMAGDGTVRGARADALREQRDEQDCEPRDADRAWAEGGGALSALHALFLSVPGACGGGRVVVRPVGRASSSTPTKELVPGTVNTLLRASQGHRQADRSHLRKTSACANVVSRVTVSGAILVEYADGARRY